MTLLLPLLFLLPTPQGPSVKDLFDGNLAQLRSAQAEDGSYGTRATTAHAVMAYALSPRSYRAEDGPFVRRAIDGLLPPAGTGDDATEVAVLLALQATDAVAHAKVLTEGCIRLSLDPADLAAWVASGHGYEDAVARWPSLPDPGVDSAGAILSALPPDGPLKQQAKGLATAALAWHWERNRAAASAADATGRAAASAQAGIDWLLEARAESGLWEVFGRPEPGISALCARALLAHGSEEARQGGILVLDYLKTLQQEDGSIHGGHLPTYVTSVAVMALRAGGRAEDSKTIDRAVAFLMATQADAGEGYSEEDKFYGGIGYGGDLRPDLSNLQFALQAIHDAEAGSDDAVYERALRFLERCQNRSETNTGTYTDPDSGATVASGDDGGGTYAPGMSKAGVTRLADGTLVMRSYGSMTYALLKCYLFAGLPLDDPRVEAAVTWIRRHYTLDLNPGFDTLQDPSAGFQGLYYYYLSMAEALDASGMQTLTTPDGGVHDWRAELAARLVALQAEDGSWVNDRAERWWEGNPVLCTAYALIALDRCVP